MKKRGKGIYGKKIILIVWLSLLIAIPSILPPTHAFSEQGHPPFSPQVKRGEKNGHLQITSSDGDNKGEKGEPYTDIRRRFRILEFLSLGSLMVLACALIWYLLTIKGRSEDARKVTAERYRVKELDTESSVQDHMEELLARETTFSLTSGGERYQGRICALDHSGDIFQLDQLSPPGLEQSAGGDGKVKIEYLYDEVPYTFIALIEEREGEKGEPLTFKVWGIIKYTQRRHSYRVKPSPLEPVACVFSGREGKDKGLAIDLSSGGVSVMTEKIYQEGDELKCILSLPGEKKARLSGSVIYSLSQREEEGGKKRCLGITFIAPGIDEEKALMKYVTRTRKG